MKLKIMWPQDSKNPKISIATTNPKNGNLTNQEIEFKSNFSDLFSNYLISYILQINELENIDTHCQLEKFDFETNKSLDDESKERIELSEEILETFVASFNS